MDVFSNNEREKERKKKQKPEIGQFNSVVIILLAKLIFYNYDYNYFVS